jgi:hypothetical protein
LTDLKSYFSQGCSGPSTRASGVADHHEAQLQGEEEVAHVLIQEVNGEGNAHVQVQARQDDNSEEVNGQEFEGITEFNPDHIISDPVLHIPIDRFAPNIRDEVRRALIAKGLTQPIGHKFPQSHDKRRFQKHWFRQHSWLEYSVEKNKAYCFYCYLLKHDRMDDKFCHDAFTKVGLMIRYFLFLLYMFRLS